MTLVGGFEKMMGCLGRSFAVSRARDDSATTNGSVRVEFSFRHRIKAFFGRVAAT